MVVVIVYVLHLFLFHLWSSFCLLSHPFDRFDYQCHMEMHVKLDRRVRLCACLCIAYVSLVVRHVFGQAAVSLSLTYFPIDLYVFHSRVDIVQI
jgi:hypothetical protein